MPAPLSVLPRPLSVENTGLSVGGGGRKLTELTPLPRLEPSVRLTVAGAPPDTIPSVPVAVGRLPADPMSYCTVAPAFVAAARDCAAADDRRV